MEGAGRGGAVRRGEAVDPRHPRRVVGRDCALDLLLDDLKEDLRGPIELVRAGEGFSLHTRPAFGPAVRVAFDVPADARRLTRLEAGVLMAVAYFQPVTRGELSETFGREILRDLIAGLPRRA
jgi:chromosome segregation and condensation protein ScpB